MKKLLITLFPLLMLASCVPSTPQARIQRDPRKFEELGGNHQSLVQQGRITSGMTTDAVYLAWGNPSRVFQGSSNGKATERWDYAGTMPVSSSGFYGGYGRGYGLSGRYGHPGYVYGLGPEVAYVPYRIASVWFINSRVDSWERAR